MANKQIRIPKLPPNDETIVFGPETIDGEEYLLTGKDINDTVLSIRANAEDKKKLSDRLMKQLLAAYCGHERPEPDGTEYEVFQKHASNDCWTSIVHFAPDTYVMLRWHTLIDDPSITEFTSLHEIKIEHFPSFSER
ncbi:hypothetical protein [Roseibium sp. SCP14]|uniref:hypothetical protein n=1 Tax=Roseibium sp. SCP14 TaxID=3141375 RepID=UPI00333A2835